MKIKYKDLPRCWQRKANIIARNNGYGRATEIILGETNKVVTHEGGGYVKNTTGEYVSNAYRNKFGWKNTHYKYAKTIIEVAP